MSKARVRAADDTTFQERQNDDVGGTVSIVSVCFFVLFVCPVRSSGALAGVKFGRWGRGGVVPKFDGKREQFSELKTAFLPTFVWIISAIYFRH